MRRLSPALVVSVIALFVALGGTSYAVTQLPKNSVGTQQLRKSAVTSAKIKDGTIATADLASATRSELKGQKGDTGAPGATGATGATGPQGPAGPTASGWATTTVDVPLTPALTFYPVLELGSTASATSSGPVTVTGPSRLVVHASLDLYKGTGQNSNVGGGTCVLQYKSSGSVLWSTVGTDADLTLADVVPGAAVYATVSPTAVADVAAGSYEVRARCRRYNDAALGNAEVVFTSGSLTVVAVAS